MIIEGYTIIIKIINVQYWNRNESKIVTYIRVSFNLQIYKLTHSLYILKILHNTDT